MRIVVQAEPFDYGAECARFAEQDGGVGAIVSFAGVVRSTPEAPVTLMEIEHYPGMTEAALSRIAEEAVQRWQLVDVLVIHRHGALRPGETIMMVATAAAHRAAAFEAADFLMDYLKSRAPFWKKEHGPEGETWVAAKETDEAALDRW